MQLARTAVLICVGMTLASPAPAQSLVEAAKREKERRAKVEKKEPVKSFTNADLETSGSLANDPSDPPAVAEPTRRAPEKSSSTRARSTGRGESYWRSRAKRLRDRVAAAEKKVAAAERQAGAAGPTPRGDYKVRCKAGRLLMPDGSLGPVTDNCATVGLDGDRSRAAQSRLQAAQRELEQARQALARLEEEARKAGALPGWLR